MVKIDAADVLLAVVAAIIFVRLAVKARLISPRAGPSVLFLPFHVLQPLRPVTAFPNASSVVLQLGL